MSVAGALPHGGLARAVAGQVDTTAVRSRGAVVASFGVIVLVLVAPFETLNPLLRLPGQSLSTVEAVLLAVPAVPAAAWTAFVAASLISAVFAPALRTNALHMTARLALAAAVWALTAIGAESERDRRRIVLAVVISGVVVGALVLADFLDVPGTSWLLARFRAGVAVVGAQVRATGPFQYPTIASMYLEIAFAVGIGLLVSLDPDRPIRQFVLIAALALVVEAIVFTFTRAGLLTVALSLAIGGASQWMRHGFGRTTRAVCVLAIIAAIELLSSRSLEMLALRLTTEGQGRWFSAVFEVPSRVTLDTRTPIDIPITVTNTGRATWDSDAAEPIKLSYHWVAEDSEEVIAWEGIRTLFDQPIRPGETVSLTPQVGGPGKPGRFRLMWDIEQEHRLWFSTEPDAYIAFSSGVVTGPVTTTRIGAGPSRIPRMAVRPGRMVLWGAAWRMFLERPFLGIGADNYRLRYGQYSTIKEADPRVHSNSMYFEVLAGTGLLGAAAFLWLGAVQARAAIEALASSPIGVGIAAACAAIAVHGLVDSFMSFSGTYILMAVALGLASASARERGRRAHRI
jgi:O-Antigen ligase